jgi:fructokinase
MIVVAGESLFDVFASETTPQGLSLDGRMGGSPLNVAIGLARLGQQVAFAGAVGRDVAAERLMRALVDEGVQTGCVAQVDAPTSLMLVGLDAHGVPTYTFIGDRGADRQLLPAHLGAVPRKAAAYHVGSYSMVVNPTGSTLRALIERESAGSVISYDPNVRLRVEPDVERWRSTLRWMLRRVGLLKASAEDLEILFPGRSPADFAAEAVSAGAGLVVVTRGSAGASGYAARAAVDIPAAPVAVVDTVGAGDTFQAALLAWLSETGRLEASALAALESSAVTAALTFATRAAAITCGRRGADMPRREELPPEEAPVPGRPGR